ncbi:MAG TPA: hypothetical protein VGW12_15940 [Pyrinomonadaceae bacterium]|nr:hypothetical protein [Pyrinomonadaceae bacterium]
MLERRLQLSYLLIISAALLIAVASASTWSSNAQNNSAPSILRARGLIIEDAQGRERILLGAPVPQVAGRKRKDAATGLVFLGENGADRITLGDEPDPMVNGKVYPRRVPGVGILIHDPDGTERGGYGVLNDGSAVLTLDWSGSGEGFSASVNDRQGFAGAGVWHKSPLGVYREGVTMGVINKNNEAFLKLTDGTGTQRARLQQQGASDPQLLLYDNKGQVLGDTLKR